MEDIQLITYIIFAVLYLIFKVMQKKKKGPDQEQGEIDPQQRRPQKPAMTFEEMLRDFTGEPLEETETIEEEVRPERQPSPRKRSPMPEPPKDFSYESQYDQQAHQTYSESIEKGKKALTLDEQVDYSDIKVGKVQIIEDDIDAMNIPIHGYLEAFDTLDGAKKAFVYSEIFNRKYT